MSGYGSAVVLARGLGTRMRHQDGARLSLEQEVAACAGMKAMIPVGRPFLDYILSALADAGFRRVCLVIGPEHQAVREHYNGPGAPWRVALEFAVQEKPLGTADAVAAAEWFARGEPVVVINSDNYYPARALRKLADLPGAGLVAFDRSGLLEGNISPQRIAQFAVLETDAAGLLRRVIEKPDEATLAAMPAPLRVSMNCWRFMPSIFRACRAVRPSPRGELELTDAVAALVAEGEPFTAVPFSGAVLDMSCRTDVQEVAERLKDVVVSL